jgi:hypothetical protein
VIVRANWHNLIGFSFTGLLVFAGSLEARAGFVLAGLEHAPPVRTERSMRASAPGEPLPAAPLRLDRIVPNVVGHHTPGSTMSGQGSSITRGGSTAPVALLPMQAGSSTGDLLAYRLSEPGIALPVPFLDGVFRPPRG